MIQWIISKSSAQNFKILIGHSFYSFSCFVNINMLDWSACEWKTKNLSSSLQDELTIARVEFCHKIQAAMLISSEVIFLMSLKFSFWPQFRTATILRCSDCKWCNTRHRNWIESKHNIPCLRCGIDQCWPRRLYIHRLSYVVIWTWVLHFFKYF